MLRIAFVLSLVAAAGLGQAPPPDRVIWETDFAAARARARAEQKDLLVLFIATDWCSWSKRLDARVLASPQFRDYAKAFVTVRLEYPQAPSLLAPDLKTQNERMLRLYPIQGFPTILLMDHAGRVFARSVLIDVGAGDYVAMLTEQQQLGETSRAASASAEGKQGTERARALDAALTALAPEIVACFHAATMKEIVELDADGRAGLRAKYASRVEQMELERLTNDVAVELGAKIEAMLESREFGRAFAALEEVRRQPKTKVHEQFALFFQGLITMEDSGDSRQALDLLERAKAIAPDTLVGRQIDILTPRIRKQAEGDGK